MSCGKCGMQTCQCPGAPVSTATAYDRAQAENEQRLRKLEALKIQTDARFDNAFRRLEELELEVARLKGPHGVPGQVHADYAHSNLEDQAAIAKQLGGRGLGPSPAVAYPPLPDEGT